MATRKIPAKKVAAAKKAAKKISTQRAKARTTAATITPAQARSASSTRTAARKLAATKRATPAQLERSANKVAKGKAEAKKLSNARKQLNSVEKRISTTYKKGAVAGLNRAKSALKAKYNI